MDRIISSRRNYCDAHPADSTMLLECRPRQCCSLSLEGIEKSSLYFPTSSSELVHLLQGTQDERESAVSHRSCPNCNVLLPGMNIADLIQYDLELCKVHATKS